MAMFIPKLRLMGAFGIFVSIAISQSSQPLCAQTNKHVIRGSVPPLITVLTGKDQMRFAALTLARSLRVEILSATGEVVFDSGSRPGNTLQWPPQSGEGMALKDGLYGCVVTVEELDKTITYRRGLFRVENGSPVFDEPEGAVDGLSDRDETQLTILQASDGAPLTLVTHDGGDGWVESATGALNLNAGSLSRQAGAVPHLRVTSEGNLGIGVAEPVARLDVGGLIRTSEGIMFPDGTVQRTASGLGGLLLVRNEVDSGIPASGKDAAGSRRSMLGDPSMRALGPSYKSPAGRAAAAGGSQLLGQEGGEPFYDTFYGLNAGGLVTTGYADSFFGYNAGASTTTGSYNAFFGAGAGSSNSTGDNNSFFGDSAGLLNTEGYHNAFFGAGAGYSTTAGYYNSFFGGGSGSTNTSGYGNSFVGAGSGSSNTTGYDNSFFGTGAGYYSTTGSGNSYFGLNTGFTSTTEDNNSLFGSYSDIATGLTNAAAIGHRAKANQSNTLILGSIGGVNGAVADTAVGIGTTDPNPSITRLNVSGSFSNPSVGARAIVSNSFFTPSGDNAGVLYGLESGANYTGPFNLTRSHRNTSYALGALIGYYGGTVASGSSGAGTVATIVGIAAQNILRNSITVSDAMGLQVQPAVGDVGTASVENVYGMYVRNPSGVTATSIYGLYTEPFTSAENNYGIFVSGNSKSYFGGSVGIGTVSPEQQLHVVGNLWVTGAYLGPSDARLKKAVKSLNYGLDELLRLRPVSFEWKDGEDGKLNLGLIAQEVESIIPEIVERNKDTAGTMGLNYSSLIPILIKAVQEQQSIIQEQKAAIERKSEEVSALNCRLIALEQTVQRLAKEYKQRERQQFPE
jgi:hypothetical protein